MDILKMLQNDADELCKEDIEMIKEELDIGEYTSEYINQCNIYISKIIQAFEPKKREKVYQQPQGLASDLIKKEDIPTVDTEASGHKTKSEEFRENIQKIRSKPNPGKNFSEYARNYVFFTNEFIDQNMNEFNEIERNILLRERNFSEEFLEKYFDILDHGTLAINQLYSEEFFMRHFSELPTKAVLTLSKNPWRQKSKRSKKLDSFLRIKGVKI